MELALVNGLISFKAPLFGLQEMIFTRMVGNMELDNGTLKVNRLQVAGDQIQGDFQGNIRLESDLPLSRIALRGDVPLPRGQHGTFCGRRRRTVSNPVVTPL